MATQILLLTTFVVVSMLLDVPQGSREVVPPVHLARELLVQAPFHPHHLTGDLVPVVVHPFARNVIVPAALLVTWERVVEGVSLH